VPVRRREPNETTDSRSIQHAREQQGRDEWQLAGEADDDGVCQSSQEVTDGALFSADAEDAVANEAEIEEVAEDKGDRRREIGQATAG
jgi:hypothetical protein